MMQLPCSLTSSVITLKSNMYVRTLFVGFSPAFNTMLPSVLIGKLRDLSVQDSLSAWIENYLNRRTLRVKFGGNIMTGFLVLELHRAVCCL